MKFFLLIALLIGSHTLFAQVPSGDSCDYYKQLEDVRLCSEQEEDYSSYLKKYGYPICQHFLEKAEVWNDARADWVHKVALCLQQKVDEVAHQASCRDIEIHAFNSHPDCYKDSGFCGLKRRHQLSILRQLAKRKEVFKKLRLTLKQGIRLLKKCLKPAPGQKISKLP